MNKYESRMEGDRWWWPIEKSTTVDGRLVAWMEENGATHTFALMADGWKFEVRLVGTSTSTSDPEPTSTSTSDPAADTSDTFTAQHLRQYAEKVCFEDEREDFVLWVEELEADDLAHYVEVGWPAALNYFREFVV